MPPRTSLGKEANAHFYFIDLHFPPYKTNSQLLILNKSHSLRYIKQFVISTQAGGRPEKSFLGTYKRIFGAASRLRLGDPVEMTANYFKTFFSKQWLLDFKKITNQLG